MRYVNRTCSGCRQYVLLGWKDEKKNDPIKPVARDLRLDETFCVHNKCAQKVFFYFVNLE